MSYYIFIILTFLTLPMFAQQSNYHFSHTDSTTASSDKIWKIWTDVPNWKQWDKGLKDAFIDGEFVTGAKGKLTSDKGSNANFVISELQPGVSYTFKTKIPLGYLVIKRTLRVNDRITYFTHDVEFTGMLKTILGKQLGVGYRAMLPDVMSSIKTIAEAR